MSAQPKQPLRQLVMDSSNAGKPSARASRRPKQQGRNVEKQGTELKCGCGPSNGLPPLRLQPRTLGG